MGWRFGRLGAVAIILMFPSVAFGGSFYVDIVGSAQGNIDGNVTSPTEVAGQIEAFELHHFVSRPDSPGAPAVHEAIVFTKNRMDPSTVPLLQAWDQGELLTVTFTFCTPTSCDPVLFTINLTGARVTVIEPWTRGDDNLERIRVVYQSIEFVFPGDDSESVTLVP